MDFKREKVVEELHKPARRNYARRKVIVRDIDETWQADLVDLKMYSKENRGYTFLLTVIDNVSKYAWALPLKQKTEVCLKNALSKIFKEGRIPKKLQVDRGSEFYNKDVKSLLASHKIHMYSSYSNLKASIIERFNRTIKNEMWKKFTLNGNHKWVDILDTLILQYNNHKHRTIGMKPVDVNHKNLKTLLDRIRSQKYYKYIKDKPKFKVNDVVRISKLKHIFEKGYTPNWGTELLTIRKVFSSEPYTYYLKDYKNEEIAGAFYEEELQKCRYSDVYLIEKIIKKQGDKLFVKWLGFDDSHNQWVSKDDL